MKPGKPTTFATCFFQNKKKYLLCLPGNPVSATVTMNLFALPLLKQLCKDFSMPTIVSAKVCNVFMYFELLVCIVFNYILMIVNVIL